MPSSTITKPAPIDLLANLPVGASFTVNGRAYEMADGFEIQPAAGKATFNVYDSTGALRRLHVKATTKVIVLGAQH